MVTNEFERNGGSLTNIPVMFVDLARLGGRTDNGSSRTAEEKDGREGALPPKLKMKYSHRKSVDNVSS